MAPEIKIVTTDTHNLDGVPISTASRSAKVVDLFVRTQPDDSDVWTADRWSCVFERPAREYRYPGTAGVTLRNELSWTLCGDMGKAPLHHASWKDYVNTETHSLEPVGVQCSSKGGSVKYISFDNFWTRRNVGPNETAVSSETSKNWERQISSKWPFDAKPERSLANNKTGRGGGVFWKLKDSQFNEPCFRRYLLE